MFIEIKIPEGVEARIEGKRLFIKGEKGEVSREFKHPWVDIALENNSVKFSSDVKGKRGKMMVNTFAAHLRNMIKGVQEGYTYKLRIVFSHFPINVKVEGDWVVIENFFGEKKPRKARIMQGTTVKINGDEIIVEGVDKEKTGQTAANIENASKRSGYDKRKFQDGIYIFEKAGRQLA